MRVLTVLGARPQFIKAMPLCRALRDGGIEEYLVHTGQHYDAKMSDVFFDELDLPGPQAHLSIGSGSHGEQTGRMLIALEHVILSQNPDVVLVYGDTNSTLAGALATSKLRVPLAHVEAGLRSFNRAMPEEINRILTDHCSTLLFCPTSTAADNLAREGIADGVHLVGDTMQDALRLIRPLAQSKSNLVNELMTAHGDYLLLTLHRPYTVDDPGKLTRILDVLACQGMPVIFPVHPRTLEVLRKTSYKPGNAIRPIEPVGYVEMLALEDGARAILTDSGGVQKEAYMLGIPCLTLRPETEWVETLEGGWNRLVPSEPEALEKALGDLKPRIGQPPPIFGDGHAAQRIVEVLTRQI